MSANDCPTWVTSISPIRSATLFTCATTSFIVVSACIGELEVSREQRHCSPVGASKVVNIANGAVRFMKV